MHISAATSADEQARRLPTSGRRKLPSGNFRSARDLRSQRESAVGRRTTRLSQSPLARHCGRRAARLAGVPRGRAPDACDLLHPWGTCLAGYRTGTELQVVMAGAWIAVSGSAHGERRVSGVRRAAPLWWFFPDRRVSTHPVERCQLQRASRATSERQKRNGDIPQFPAQRANGVRPLPRCVMHPRHLMRSDPIC